MGGHDEMTVKPKLSCLHAEEARVTRASVVSRGVTMRQFQVDVDNTSRTVLMSTLDLSSSLQRNHGTPISGITVIA